MGLELNCTAGYITDAGSRCENAPRVRQMPSKPSPGRRRLRSATGATLGVPRPHWRLSEHGRADDSHRRATPSWLLISLRVDEAMAVAFAMSGTCFFLPAWPDVVLAQGGVASGLWLATWHSGGCALDSLDACLYTVPTARCVGCRVRGESKRRARHMPILTRAVLAMSTGRQMMAAGRRMAHHLGSGCG